jgi:cystathionine beta-lyase family protein involved in aluminum resistance
MRASSGRIVALVRIGFVNGTHAIVSALFSAVGPGETCSR